MQIRFDSLLASGIGVQHRVRVWHLLYGWGNISIYDNSLSKMSPSLPTDCRHHDVYGGAA